MCNNCQYKGINITVPTNLAAENEELLKQVSALTQALETQNRGNHPYIQFLKEENDRYSEMVDEARKERNFMFWIMMALLIGFSSFILYISKPTP
ncbi:hypothetical protein Cpin_3844 [Chitinophaga pinensis DSM 2588]|uniref:Coiled-coil domain-containing protein 167 n=1 Tax=Chitinophaga pinensis (strain ATCC 43595 / DSM 2588 / LMG 13176 / NBRC 15968 / NCIMB 11800 / UQM 2034) TaxID=485918 RepID=A0A979G5R0_CHIPD|nr:hypothetical protein Cpin_3844 [Chitinophaga pinensis DSM 2588]